MIKKVFPYLVFILLLVSVLLLYGFSSLRNDSMKIESVTIEFKEGNNYFLNFDSVDKLLIQNNKPVKNQLKSSVDLHDLEKKVNRSYYVEEANVCMTLDGDLKVDVKQRKPVARIVSKKNTYYVDKYSCKFPLSSNYSARVPLVTGVKTKQEIDEVVALLLFISEDDFLKKEVIAIVKNSLKEYELSVRSGDYKIDLGTIENVDVKFKKLRAFYNVALADSSIHKYKKITIKYHNQVVCTKKDKNG